MKERREKGRRKGGQVEEEGKKAAIEEVLGWLVKDAFY